MAMEKIKMEITSEGVIRMLHSDLIDLSKFGKAKIRRASNVEFNNRAQAWKVTSAKTRKLLKGGFDTREKALAWEKVYYSPGGKGWAELTKK